jgi:DNA polymerase III subunit gamma/tau
VSYQVFARKYRPQTFEDLVGQEHVSRTLKNAVDQSRLAHAYLFVGPRGIGKTSTARILAKALNCIHGPTTTPCGKCDNCKEIAAGNSLDVLEIDGASNNGVEQVRELRDNVRYAPAKSRYKIYIIDEVHMLSSAAFNALLKTLEEPPEHVKFVFATTEPQKVLPTILSRCQRFDLHRIPANLIADHLQYIAREEKVTLEPAAAHAIARAADGGLRDAESMLDQLVAFCGETIAESEVLNIFGLTSEQTVADLTGKILRGETSAALAVLDEQAALGKEMMKLISDLIAHLRDLLVFKVRPAALSGETAPELQSSLGEEARLVETDRLLELIEQFAEAEGRMKWAPNKKLHFEVALIKAIQTLGQATLDEVIEKLAALRDGSGGSGTRTPSVVRQSPPPGQSAAKKSETAESTLFSKPTSVSKETTPPQSEAKEAAAIWAKVTALVSARRPFIRPYLEAGQLLESEEGELLLGFAPEQKMAMESLARPNSRSSLEALLKEVSGRNWSLKMRVIEGLAPVEKPSREEPAKSRPNDGSQSFRDDPLIKEALEIFKGEIRSATT